jgi:ATPase subunit of ABC transporter with duplicated ATPase domains
MKRLTLEQILSLYPDALIFNMLDIRVRKDRQAALKGLAGTYILFCHDRWRSLRTALLLT